MHGRPNSPSYPEGIDYWIAKRHQRTTILRVHIDHIPARSRLWLPQDEQRQSLKMVQLLRCISGRTADQEGGFWHQKIYLVRVAGRPLYGGLLCGYRCVREDTGYDIANSSCDENPAPIRHRLLFMLGCRGARGPKTTGITDFWVRARLGRMASSIARPFPKIILAAVTDSSNRDGQSKRKISGQCFSLGGKLDLGQGEKYLDSSASAMSSPCERFASYLLKIYEGRRSRWMVSRRIRQDERKGETVGKALSRSWLAQAVSRWRTRLHERKAAHQRL